jgi:3-hydroxyisobutyrate dehydrogenase-like beta-hydroxyacid dehydrogenase
MRVAVFGLGEAGAAISADLARLGCAVSGFDPADVEHPDGVERCIDPRDAVSGADLVLALTASADAMGALQQAVGAYERDVLYADLSTGSPGSKRSLAAAAATSDLAFVDVALMSTVPGKGLSTPAVASGAGASRYVETMAAFGVTVEDIGGEAGDAATRKLLRSVVVKGLAAVIIESMRAAHQAGLADETYANVVAQLGAADETFVRRLVEGTGPHAERRAHEMEAASDMLRELGVAPVMTDATIRSLRAVREGGLPVLPYSATPRSSQ